MSLVFFYMLLSLAFGDRVAAFSGSSSPATLLTGASLRAIVPLRAGSALKTGKVRPELTACEAFARAARTGEV
jgi:hypothetical protein